MKYEVTVVPEVRSFIRALDEKNRRIVIDNLRKLQHPHPGDGIGDKERLPLEYAFSHHHCHCEEPVF